MTDSQAIANRQFFDDLKGNERRYGTVPVTKWEKTVTVQRLTGPEKMELLDFQEGFPRQADGTFANAAHSFEFAVELAARSIVDEDHRRVFDDAEGRAFLGRQDLDTLFELMDAILDLNELGSVEIKLAEAKKK